MNRFSVVISFMVCAQAASGQINFTANNITDHTSIATKAANDSVFLTSSAIEGHFIAPSVIFLSVDFLNPPKQFSQVIAGSLSLENIPQIDRSIIYFDTNQAAIADKWSDNLNFLSFGIGAATLLSSPHNKQVTFNNIVLYTEGALLTYGITEVLKSTMSRIRPYAYNEALPDSYRFREDVTSSFPSGHTSSTAYNCFFAATILNERFIADNKTGLKVITWTIAASIPAITGYLRTAAGKHFYTDVAAGYAIGALIGYGVPTLHKIANNAISMYPISTTEFHGLGFNVIW